MILVIQPPPVAGIGNAGGVRMMVEDRAGRGSQALLEATTAMVTKASQTPGLTQVFTLFENSTPQIYLDIDRTKAQMLGVNVADVFGALQVYIGSAYVNDFNLLGRTFRVTAQADAPYRRDPSDILKIRVRNASGETVPLGSFTTVRDIAGPYRVPRYNLYPAAELDGDRCPWLLPGPGHRRVAEDRRRDPARRVRIRVDDARVSADQGRQHRAVCLRTCRRVRLPCAGGAIRELDASAGRDPDRADVPRGFDQRRDHARDRTTTSSRKSGSSCSSASPPRTRF